MKLSSSRMWIALAIISISALLAWPSSGMAQQEGVIESASIPPAQSFSCGVGGPAFSQTSFGISDHANVAQFNSPGSHEHIVVGAVRSGYQVCYRPCVGFVCGPFFTAFDAGAGEGVGFSPPLAPGAFGLVPPRQPNGPNTFPLTICRETTDGRAVVCRRFTGNSFVAPVPPGNPLDLNGDGVACDTLNECGNCTNRTVHVLTTVHNISGESFFLLRVAELVNFNIDGSTGDDRAVKSTDSVSIYEDDSDAAGMGNTAFGMLVQTLIQPADTQVFPVGGYVFPDSCIQGGVVTPTAIGDWEAYLMQEIVSLAPGANTGNSIRIHYRRW